MGNIKSSQGEINLAVLVWGSAALTTKAIEELGTNLLFALFTCEAQTEVAGTQLPGAGITQGTGKAQTELLWPWPCKISECFSVR